MSLMNSILKQVSNRIFLILREEKEKNRAVISLHIHILEAS